MLSRHLRHLTHYSNTSVTCCICPVHTTDHVRLQNPAVIVEVVELLHEVSAADCNCSAALRYSSSTLLFSNATYLYCGDRGQLLQLRRRHYCLHYEPKYA
jgi:hypothetical protein